MLQYFYDRYSCQEVWWPDCIGIQKCLLQSVSCFDFSHSLRKSIRFGSAILTLRCDVPLCPPRKRGGNNLDLLPPIWNENYLPFTFSQPVSHIWPCLETIEKIPKRTRSRSLIAPNPRSQFNQCTAAADKLCKTKISPFCSNKNNV